MADQNSSVQDKILQIRLAQAKLQAQKDNKEPDMGAGVDDYSRLANAEKLYREQFGLDDSRLFKPDGSFRSPEAEETYKQRKEKFDAAIGPMRAAIERRNAKAGFGSGAGGGGKGSGGSGGAIGLESIPKEGFVFIPRSQQEYQALPPNSQYKDPDGTVRTKPDRSNNPPA